MPVTIQLRRDTAANLASVVPAEGEILLATNTKEAVIGDGSSETFSQLVAANKSFFFHTGRGHTLGGTAADESIIIQGNGTQSVPILKVVNSNSQSVLEVTDNDTQLVKIDATNGDTGDISLLIKAKASQTAGAIEVQDSADSTPRFQVKEEGQTLIDPNDTTDPSLQIKKSSGDQSNGILRVNEGGTAEFKVLDAGIEVSGTSALDGNVTGKAITTIQNGSDDTDRVVIKGLASGNVIETFENNVSKFKVEADGTVTGTDAEVSATGRTITAPTLLRADEMGYGYRVVALKKGSSQTAFFFNAASGGSQILFDPLSTTRYHYQADQGGSIVVSFTVSDIDGNNEKITYTDPDGTEIFIASHNKTGGAGHGYNFTYTWHMAPGSSFTAFNPSSVGNQGGSFADYQFGYVSRMKF